MYLGPKGGQGDWGDAIRDEAVEGKDEAVEGKDEAVGDKDDTVEIKDDCWMQE